MAPVRRGGKWGYIDRRGRWAIEPRFAEADEFSEGLAAVDLGDKQIAYIDHEGRIVLRIADVEKRWAAQEEVARLARMKRESIPYSDPFDRLDAGALVRRVFVDGEVAALPALLQKIESTELAKMVAALPHDATLHPQFPAAVDRSDHVVTIEPAGELVSIDQFECPPRSHVRSLCLLGFTGTRNNPNPSFARHDGEILTAAVNAGALYLLKIAPRGTLGDRVYDGALAEEPDPRLRIIDGRAEIAFVENGVNQLVSIPLLNLDWQPLPSIVIRSMAGRALTENDRQALGDVAIDIADRLYREHHWPAAARLYDALYSDLVRKPIGMTTNMDTICGTFRDEEACLVHGKR